MADNIKVPDESAGAGPLVATDEVGGRHFQIFKLAIGADGTATLIDAAGLPVTAAALPLPAGASTETTLAALKAVADTIATAAAAIKVAAEALNAKATAIDTGAIAGTVALDAGSLAALETIQVGSLPIGAATEATLASVDGKLPALSAGRIPVVLPAGGGGLTDTELRASAVPVIESGAATGAPANVAASAASVTLLASNAARKGAVIHNDSAATLYVVCHASAASTTNYTEQLAPGESLVLERGDYSGEIRGIWTAATGYARVTEIS